MPKSKASASRAGARYILKKDDEPKLEGKWYPADDVPKPRKRKFESGSRSAGPKPGKGKPRVPSRLR